MPVKQCMLFLLLLLPLYYWCFVLFFSRSFLLKLIFQVHSMSIMTLLERSLFYSLSPEIIVSVWGLQFTARRRKAKTTPSKVVGELPHICDWPLCGRGFKRADKLQRHYRTHTGTPITNPLTSDKLPSAFTIKSFWA